MAFLQVSLNVYAGRLKKQMGALVVNRCHGACDLCGNRGRNGRLDRNYWCLGRYIHAPSRSFSRFAKIICSNLAFPVASQPLNQVNHMVHFGILQGGRGESHQFGRDLPN